MQLIFKPFLQQKHVHWVMEKQIISIFQKL
jgi:hypothetical protein